jgi:mannose-6-phosphate isomerase
VSHLVPFRLTPLLVDKPWGGSRLSRIGREVAADGRVGESWDLVDLDETTTTVPDAVSRVAGGPLDGRSLRELVRERPTELLGAAFAGTERFPLLVKHIDAAEHLSVQVHPPAAMVARDPGLRLKTESWVVVAADPGAELMLGLRPDVTVDQVRDVAGTSGIVPLLRRVPAQVGDVHHLPAGVVHALGAGVVVAEVQSPSDTTFRLYDWPEEYGRAERELHLDDALTALEESWDLNVAALEPVRHDGRVVQTDLYTIDRRRTSTRRLLDVPARDIARVLVLLSGRVRIPDLGDPLLTGELAVLPAAWSGEMVSGAGAVWLEVDLGGAS